MARLKKNLSKTLSHSKNKEKILTALPNNLPSAAARLHKKTELKLYFNQQMAKLQQKFIKNAPPILYEFHD